LTRRVALVEQHGATRSSQKARQARLARHVIRGVATAWTGVDMSTLLFPEVVPAIDANPEHKRLNLYTRSLLLLRCPLCCNKHGSTRSSRRARHAWHVVHVVSWRDATSQVECGLYAVQAAVLRVSSTAENSRKPQIYREDREGTVLTINLPFPWPSDATKMSTEPQRTAAWTG